MALDYAKRGIPVFPLHSVADGRCSCKQSGECPSAGKHPRTKNGFRDAATDRRVVERWWSHWPDANIGIPTGKTTGWVVLDIDPRNGGRESLKKLEAEHGSLQATLQQRTGGGGVHFIYDCPTGESLKCRNALLPGMDFKADGGYIVAPPSRHKSGEQYQWENSLEPLPLPGLIFQLATDGSGSSGGRTSRKPTARPSPARSFKQGSRNTELMRLAGAMRRVGMQAGEIEAGLQAANANRCVPPLEKSEVLRISQSVCRYLPSADGMLKQASATLWQKLDVADLLRWECQPLVWLVEDMIARGNLVLLAAATQTGKTLFALYASLLLVRGGKLFGRYEVQGGCKVLYLALEDPDRRIKERLQDVGTGFGNGPLIEEKEAFMVHLASGFKLNAPEHVTYLERLIAQDDPSRCVVILDTYQRATPGLSSFGDEDQSRILHGLSDLTRKTGVTIIVLDHIRKSQAGTRRKRISIDDIKGTGGKAQNADAVILMERQGQQVTFRAFSKDADRPVQIVLNVSGQGSAEEKFRYSAELAEAGASRKPAAARDAILSVFKPGDQLSSSEVVQQSPYERATVGRHLRALVKEGALIKSGNGPATRYRLRSIGKECLTGGVSG